MALNRWSARFIALDAKVADQPAFMSHSILVNLCECCTEAQDALQSRPVGGHEGMDIIEWPLIHPDTTRVDKRLSLFRDSLNELGEEEQEEQQEEVQ